MAESKGSKETKQTREKFIRLVMANGRSRVVTESVALILMETGNYEWAGEHTFKDDGKDDGAADGTPDSEASAEDESSEELKVRRRSKTARTKASASGDKADDKAERRVADGSTEEESK